MKKKVSKAQQARDAEFVRQWDARLAAEAAAKEQRTFAKGEDLVKLYYNRGLSNKVVDRVAYEAYESSHAYGEFEVDSKFKSLMYSIFKMSHLDDKPAEMD